MKTKQIQNCRWVKEMSIVFEEYETKQRMMFLTSGVRRVEPITEALVLVELRNGEKYKTHSIRFVNQ